MIIEVAAVVFVAVMMVIVAFAFTYRCGLAAGWDACRRGEPRPRRTDP